jgi:hypothetical protein
LKNCEACVNELRKFISVEAYDTGDSQESKQTQSSQSPADNSTVELSENGTCSLRDLTKARPFQ